MSAGLELMSLMTVRPVNDALHGGCSGTAAVKLDVGAGSDRLEFRLHASETGTHDLERPSRPTDTFNDSLGTANSDDTTGFVASRRKVMDADVGIESCKCG